MMFVRLPWPPRILSPNCRAHWREKAPITKKYRHDCGWHAKEAGLKKLGSRRANVRVEFYPPNNRKRDLDNCIGACKALFDGIADVIGVDDCMWRMSFKMHKPTPDGTVMLTVEPME